MTACRGNLKRFFCGKLTLNIAEINREGGGRGVNLRDRLRRELFVAAKVGYKLLYIIYTVNRYAAYNCCLGCVFFGNKYILYAVFQGGYGNGQCATYVA